MGSTQGPYTYYNFAWVSYFWGSDPPLFRTLVADPVNAVNYTKCDTHYTVLL